MTQDSLPPYPRTPAYGEGRRPDAVRRSPAAATPGAGAPGPAIEPRRVWLALGLSVVVNLLTLVGVLLLHWPAGNVFLLFWCENAVLGLVTLVRIGTAEAPDRRRARGTVRLTVGSSEREVSPSSRIGSAAFFCLHYGIFAVGHLGSSAFVAWRLGVDVSFLYLGLPVVLLVVRYTVELATTWFGRDGLRGRTSPRQAMLAPYPRVVVLHVGVLVAFALVLMSLLSGLPDSSYAGFDRALSRLPSWLGQPGALAVAVLVLLKTVVDLTTTRRALRTR